MRFFIAITMSALLSIPSSSAQSVTSASATTASPSSTSTSTSSSSSSGPSVYRVNVGAGGGDGGYTYEPNTTYALVGDIVEFVFWPTNHSVIRGEYTGSDACGSGGCNPCVPYELIHGSGGFHSGNELTQTAPGDGSLPANAKVWNYTVTTTDPIWFYCNAIGSCHPNGMVGVINPNELVSLQKQKDAAISAPYELAPGQPWPAEGASVGAETATVSGYSQPTSTSANGQNQGSHHSLSGGAIAGIVIGGVVVLALAAALFYFVGSNKTYKDVLKANRSDGQGPGMSQAGDNVGSWTPVPAGNPASSTAYADHRISNMTYNSVAPSEGTFIGYNRNTGAPEFAAEAAAEQPGPQYGARTSPGMAQQPFQSSPQTKSTTFEMMGDVPGAAKKP